MLLEGSWSIFVRWIPAHRLLTFSQCSYGQLLHILHRQPKLSLAWPFKTIRTKLRRNGHQTFPNYHRPINSILSGGTGEGRSFAIVTQGGKRMSSWLLTYYVEVYYSPILAWHFVILIGPAVLVYGVLFMDWTTEFGREDKPFESVWF